MVHGKSVYFYLSLQPLNFRVWKNFSHKPATKSCRALAQAVGCNIGWHKFLVQVFHQKLEQCLTSCSQKELNTYPSFGFSEQKPLCLLAHTHTLSKHHSAIKTVIPSSISGMMRDLGMHGNTNYNTRNRLAAGLSSTEPKPLQHPTKKKIKNKAHSCTGFMSFFLLPLNYTASFEPA